MSDSQTLGLDEALSLTAAAFRACGTTPETAESVAKALVAAEVDGQKGHGLSRVASYAAQARSGKVRVDAVPRLERVAPAFLRVDADHGFAYPAIDLAIEALVEAVSECGLAAAAIVNSHHFGQATYHVERLANRGLLALLFGNSPKAIAPWGGKAGVFGTNPIALAAARDNAPPLTIDLSLSKVARGKIMAAAKSGDAIPEGWALDRAGQPTTDPAEALEGTMLPIGDAKGVALAMVVEVLAASLVGAHHGFEASSFFSEDGPPPAVGQLLLAFDPYRLCARDFSERLETLIAAVDGQEGARLPGTRRLAARQAARQHGIQVSHALVDEIVALSRTNPPTSPKLRDKRR